MYALQENPSISAEPPSAFCNPCHDSVSVIIASNLFLVLNQGHLNHRGIRYTRAVVCT